MASRLDVRQTGSLGRGGINLSYTIPERPPPPPPQRPPMNRREMLRDAVIEAARQYLAAQLRAERIHGRRGITGDESEALQTLRDSLLAERKARRG